MSHVQPDPNAAPTETTGDLLGLSCRLTAALPATTFRQGLIVTVAPGAGHGAPACYLPDLDTIEIDAAHLDGLDPATLLPASPADRERYPALWGLLVHEAAHAEHSRWRPPEDTPAPVNAAADLLEEVRMEAAHLAERPADRRWLRAAAIKLILSDLTPPAPDPATAPPAISVPAVPAQPASAGPAAPPPLRMTAQDAAHTAGLLLARTDAGILEPAETDHLETVIAAIVGPDTLDQLRAVWREARTTGDHDAHGMLALGRRWCELVGIDPDAEPNLPTGSGSTAGGEEEPGPAQPSPLADAVAAALDVIHLTNTTPTLPSPAARGAAKLAAQQAEKRTQATARQIADEVFGGNRTGRGRTTAARTRPPTVAEQAAARRLARALRDASLRERTHIKISSATPPGRLRMRAALSADAQRAAGAVPTAEPFTRTISRTTPAPPLRVGIACDVSGSMSRFAGPVASAAWILARAASHLPDADTASVTFGRYVRPITYPGTSPTLVTTFPTGGTDEAFTRALGALDGALDLTRPGTARLIVVLSDGYFYTHETNAGRLRLDRLTTSGAAVLWLTPVNDRPAAAHGLRGLRVTQLTDPAATVDTIARAAVTALRTA